MKAYVTGGTGGLGRNVIDALLRSGWEVVASHRKSSKVERLRGLDIELSEVNLYDFYDTVRSIPQETDAIFHVAANVSHWSPEKAQQWKDNVLVTRNIARFAWSRGVKLVVTSTGATYVHRGSDKEAAAKIKEQYVRTKRQAEIEVEELIKCGLDAVFVKPAIIFGRYDYNCYSRIFSKLAARKFLPVLPGEIEFCAADRVAEAHIEAFVRGKTGESYYLGGQKTDWLDIYQRISKLVGVKPPTRKTPIVSLYAIANLMLLASCVTGKPPLLTPSLLGLLQMGEDCPLLEVRKSRDDLGYSPKSIDAMLSDCHQWMLVEGMLPGMKSGEHF